MNDEIDVNKKEEEAPFKVNDTLSTPFGVGTCQGWMTTDNTREGKLVVSVRIKIDDNNRQFLNSPNIVGKYNENSINAIWCFLPESVEIVETKGKGK